MRTTLADVKNSRCPSAIGACASDPRFTAILNEAMQRLIVEGHWAGCMARYRFCAVDGCVTFPKGIASIEGIAVCGVPVPIHDFLWEFCENGLGVQGTFTSTSGSCCNYNTCGSGEAIFRGRYPTFSDIQNGNLANKKARLACDLASDVGKQVLVLGFDSNLNYVRTLQSGTIQDGELITLSQAPGTNSTTFWSSFSDLQFPSNMDGQSWLWELNTTTNTQRLIGHYDYDDVRPSYARYFLPCLNQSASSGSSCNQTLIDCIVKLDFVPVKNDTDYCIIGNIPALKEMMTAINRAELEPDSVKSNQIIAAGLATALNLLNKEVQHYRGDATVPSLRIVGSSPIMNNPVPILI